MQRFHKKRFTEFLELDITPYCRTECSNSFEIPTIFILLALVIVNTSNFPNFIHTYLDFKINLSELRQSSVKHTAPPAFWVEEERWWENLKGFSLSENYTFCK
ncbi:hypothetical protein [Leptospira noguchii]|uniref:hypothetical protein n=1 Tax=Leptospira noguchii TaxID=28182 RepID=UPI001FB5DAD4|nr:hypothetical protein [Leptospira noguchii]UOG48945.1 hypothetical protein MAL00_01010 [Leptospira noguchii]